MKYGFSLEQIEEKNFDPKEGQKFIENYDFSRLWRIKEAQVKSERYAKNVDAREKKKAVWSIRYKWKSVGFGERFRKKYALGRLHKSTIENRPYFNRNRIFTINTRVQTSDKTNYYWLNENGQKVKSRF